MKKVELLAPAGNMESLKAAINAGCDAVYLGGYMFGARSFAGNFSDEELIEAIKYAHLYGVKVYVTVNTIIYEREVNMFMEYIDFLHKNNVDAVIMQDLGMMDLVRNTYPNLEIHASTQMHIHNLEGVKNAEKIGLNRVVLARETNISDIKKIKENTDIELEIFVHGALCISYSGQCLMSKMIGGRSGNLGVCAGSCRLPYDLVEINNSKETKLNKNNYLLSMKDLNSLENLSKLLDVGVTSLKIEGRMKRPEYVYLVTSIYRKAIDSYYLNGSVNIREEDILELKKIYNREFTKGFLFGEENNNITNEYRPNHMGIKIGKVVSVTKKSVLIKLSSDVSIHDGIRILSNNDYGFTLNRFYINKKLVKEAKLGNIIEIYLDNINSIKVGSNVLKTTDYKQLNEIQYKLKNNHRKVDITGTITCEVGKNIYLEISDGTNKVSVTSKDECLLAKKICTSKEDIIKPLSKLNDTCYKFSDLEVNIIGKPFIPNGWLNELRREAVSLLNDKRLYKTNYLKCEYESNIPKISITNTNNILINNINEYNEIKNSNYDYIYINNYKDYELIKNDERVVLRLERALIHYPKLEKCLITEFGALDKYEGSFSDTSFNVVNSYTLAFLYKHGVSKVTLSYELDLVDIKEMLESFNDRYGFKANVEVVSESYPEILISKYNLLDKYKKYNNIYLKDRKNKYYKVTKNNGLMHIYHSNKIVINKDEYKKIGVTNFCCHK